MLSVQRRNSTRRRNGKEALSRGSRAAHLERYARETDPFALKKRQALRCGPYC